MAKRNYSRTEKRQIAQKVTLSAIVLITITVLLLWLLKLADSAKKSPHSEEASTEDKTDIIEVDGVKYKKKTDIITCLFLGVDAPEAGDDSREVVGGGQCDVLQLVVLDQRAKTYRRLSLNRDTMTQVKSLDEDGSVLAKTRVQLALAYAQVEDNVRNCENTADAVSGLLYGQQIDKYCSVRMGAIPALNHLAGGVTVTVEDDFSKSDPSLKMGETVRLSDDQARHFIHDRMNVGDGTNEGRMRRQEAYLAGLKPVLTKRCKRDNKYALEIYDTLEPYMVTNMSRNDFIKLAAKIVAMDEGETVEIEGSSKVGDFDFKEFTADEESLEDALLQMFYDKVEGD